MKSRHAIGNSKAAPRSSGTGIFACVGLLSALSAAAVWFFYSHGWLLYYVDAWWHSGIAASFSAALCFVIGGTFLFAAARRIFQSTAAAVAATGMVALNPNLLYLQSTAMTEAVFFAALMALLYFSVRFHESQGWAAVLGAGIATCAATLTRYEGWLLIPFAAAWF